MCTAYAPARGVLHFATNNLQLGPRENHQNQPTLASWNSLQNYLIPEETRDVYRAELPEYCLQEPFTIGILQKTTKRSIHVLLYRLPTSTIARPEQCFELYND